MGVSPATAEFLIEAYAHGVRFDRTLTVGRQTLFAGPLTLAGALRRHGVPTRSLRRRLSDKPWLADALLEHLGARDVVALDASAYEGAEILHDLNEPVPAELHEGFDVVFDGGSLEHVFDVRQALRGYMSMVKVGGRLIVQTMANNHCGHGFYQFSPELFYRALSPASGYTVERVQVASEEVELMRGDLPLIRGGRRYDVADPAEVGERVELRTRGGVSLLVQARRVEALAPLRVAPQQSDYAAAWAALPPPAPTPGPLRAAYRRLAPPELMMTVALDVAPRLRLLINPLASWRSARRRSLGNRRLYRSVT